jgi:hypothetical protein
MQSAALSQLAVSGYLLPPPALPVFEAGLPLARGGAAVRHSPEAFNWSKALTGIRSKLKTQREQFDALYREAERLRIAFDELGDIANAVYAEERKFAEVLIPQIAWLTRTLATLRKQPGTNERRSLTQGMEGWLDIVATWLELYQNLRIRLLKLASDRLSETEPSSPVFDASEAATEYLRKLIAE